MILPREELHFGSRTWIIRGVLWTLFHAFYHTTLGVLVPYLPTTLATSYAAQRTRSTWPGIIGHMVGNSAIPLLTLGQLLDQ